MKTNKLTWWQDLKWKLFWWKIKLSNSTDKAYDKHMRRKFCRYGFHKINSSYEGHGGSGQRMKFIRYLKCQHCGWLFFSKKSDKQNYLKYHLELKIGEIECQ